MSIILASHGIISTVNTSIPTIELNYVSNGDTNGFFYYLGTNGNTESFTNPIDSSLLTVTCDKSSADPYSNLTDRSSAGWKTSTIQVGSPATITITFPPPKTFKIKHLSLRTPSTTSSPLSHYMEVYGSTWLATLNPPTGVLVWYLSPDLNDPGFSSSITLVLNRNSTGVCGIGEIELYGELKLT